MTWRISHGSPLWSCPSAPGEWGRWTRGRAGYKQVLFNISPHWIFLLGNHIFKKVGFWGLVHCGTEFCLNWWSNATNFHFLFFLSRRKLQWWAWTHLALAAGHFHRQGVLRRAPYSSLGLRFHFSALQLCPSSWAVHQCSLSASLSLKMQQPFPSQNAKCLWGTRIYLLYHNRYRKSVTWGQVMCLVPLAPAPLHQARYFCLIQKTNWGGSLWVLVKRHTVKKNFFFLRRSHLTYSQLLWQNKIVMRKNTEENLFPWDQKFGNSRCLQGYYHFAQQQEKHWILYMLVIFL